MLSGLMKFLELCWKPGDHHGVPKSEERRDGLLSYRDSGDLISTAVVQANNLLEDQSHVESGGLSSLDAGPRGTFIGIYDGHGGPEASRYIKNHLFQHLKRFASEHKFMSTDVIREAIEATEEGFLSSVLSQWEKKPQIAAVGSCCLVGVIGDDANLFIANLGDSRAVLGRFDKAAGAVVSIQLSEEHNVSIESVRREMHCLHPDDPDIVVLRHNVWRVKGLIQVSRSIGDAYLKKAEFNRKPLYAKFLLRDAFKRPILTASPSVSTHRLEFHDKFLIFASDGLWEHLSNREAVDIVHEHPRRGSARRLVKAALRVAARKREMRYSDLKKIDKAVRRHFHDDITVVVLFLDTTTRPNGLVRSGPEENARSGSSHHKKKSGL